MVRTRSSTKGLGYQFLASAEAVDSADAKSQILRWQVRLGCPIFDGKICDLTEVFGVAR
jgi:hypothetical protein